MSLAIAWPGAAGAAFPGRAGRIAVVRSYNERDIYTINPDGTDDRTLVTAVFNASFFPEAMWSPDGRRLVYERDGAIWTVRGDGSDEREVAGGPSERDYAPAWSPDGAEIIYTRRTNAAGGHTDIYVVGADGNDQRALFPAPVCTRTIGYCNTRGVWSSSGRIAALSDRDGATELWSFSPDGSGALKLTSAPGTYPFFDWSPDGARLVFSHIAPPTFTASGAVPSPVEILVAAADGSQMTRIAVIDNASNAANLLPGAAVWSPDGTRIAFTGGTALPPTGSFPSVSPDVFTMNPDGSDVTRVTADGLSSVLDWQPLPVSQALPAGPHGSRGRPETRDLDPGALAFEWRRHAPAAQVRERRDRRCMHGHIDTGERPARQVQRSRPGAHDPASAPGVPHRRRTQQDPETPPRPMRSAPRRPPPIPAGPGHGDDATTHRWRRDRPQEAAASCETAHTSRRAR